MYKKSQWRWGIVTFFTAVLSTVILFPHTVQAQEDTVAEDPYLVDDFEGYMEDEGMLSEIWATNGEERSSYAVTLSTDQVYEGEYALKFEYRQSEIGWGGCEIAKMADWSGCNALQFWIVPDGQKQRIVVQINTASGGSFEAYLLDYPEYAEADTPLLVTLPFSAFVSPGNGKTLTGDMASDVYSMGFWISAVPDSGTFDTDGYVEGTLYFDSVRAVNATNLQETVLERWSEGGFLGEKISEPEKPKTTAWLVVVALISGVIFIISFSWFVTLAGKRKQGVDEDGNDSEE